ncbi:membrane protein [Pandoraea iniqua]|uniref:Membrane protein n=1 Tax=Pandoraea iniqua TaxID=2508288 RepID=A0A5E4ZEL6_9BURK|nr:membrane protein [Pandoraea iniqua]VVE58972.1 membrane protein [Pandoraea iniqua]
MTIRKQITYISPGQTAKALVLVYLTFSIPLVLLAFLAAFLRYGDLPGLAFISALILNAILGFVLLWIACHAYNWVAERFGGIEIALGDVPDDEDE